MIQGTKYVSAKTLEAIEKALAHGDRVEADPGEGRCEGNPRPAGRDQVSLWEK